LSAKQTIENARGHLMAHAIRWLGRWSGQDPTALLADLPADRGELAPYRRLLGESWPEAVPGAPLLSIFSRVRDPQGKAPVPRRYWPPGVLDLDKVPAPQDTVAPDPAALQARWAGFAADAGLVRTLPIDDDAPFEAFTHLLHKWAWAVPCSHGEPGVSLYDEFRALSALVFASGCTAQPASQFLLVGGDIPGIQDFVYTITSKGAAKGLRGRSFFIQLLGDAVVRRLLGDLELPEANVVYAAGGNFVLLAPDDPETLRALARVLQDVNGRLVEAIQGDTALVLCASPVAARDLFTPGRFKEVRDELGAQVAAAKGQPLRELMGDWATLFEPQGKGSRLSCAVCHIEVDDLNSKPLEAVAEDLDAAPLTAGPPRICNLCESFGELARDIRYDDLWMIVQDVPHLRGTPVEPQDGWPELLARMTGFLYSFSHEQPAAKGSVLAVNEPDFARVGAHGFRLLANVTPRTTIEDVEYLRTEAGWEEKDLPSVGEIRNFTLLVHAAAATSAIERMGVLRMDVDGLGWVFSEGMPDLTLLGLSALSGMMELFFGGLLNTLVRHQAENDLYVIYAGGDDLFVVGAWHHLPYLAELIRNQFVAFAGDNPLLSISGGITLEGSKFPLYRAAERAEEAEGKAKRHTRPTGQAKDALCFLDTVVGWEDWPLVRDQKDELLWLIGEDVENRSKQGAEKARRLPRRLLQLVQSIHGLYRLGLQDARRRIRVKNRDRLGDKQLPLPDPRMFLGRWEWMRVYSMTRLADRSKKDVPEAPARIEELQRQIMKPAVVRYSGLAARWAEYLVRARDDTAS
jgi:CRISPR-associated protein Csm1